MADKKISQLNAATTIFDADDFAVVQDGETKQTNASVVKTYVKDGLSKSDVGLGNVDNTSDATKNSATVTLTNKTISGSNNTLSNIGNSSLTNSAVTIGSTSVSLGGTATALTGLQGVSTTTLTTSSTVTLNGGTANGVGYLNASKVLTTGTALTFDGTRLVATATTGAATTYPAYFDNSGGGDGTGSRIGFRNTGTSYGEVGYVFSGGFGFVLDSANSGNTRFLIGGSEQMRLTSTGLGIGTSSPGARLQVNFTTNPAVDNGAGLNTLRVYTDVAFGADIGGALSLGGKYNSTTELVAFGQIAGRKENATSGNLAGYIGFSTLNSAGTMAEKMRLDSSGNLGIGTSPSVKLHISGSGDQYARVATTNVSRAGLQISANGTLRSVLLYDDNAGTTFLSTASALGGTGQPLTIESGSSITLATAGSTRAVLDTSGNLGLGVTPSGWGGSYKIIQFPSGNFGAYSSTSISMGQNFYDSGVGAFKYIASSYASNYYQNSGQHIWQTAPSGTAGNAITFTQAMTLTAAGDLLVGTTSASGRLTVSAPASTFYGAFNAATDGYAYLTLRNAGVECGYIGPGAIGPGNHMSIAAAAGFPLIFGTNGAERVRITSAGDLLVGNTGLTDKFSSETSSSTQVAIRANATNASYGGTVIYGTTTRGGTSGFDFIGLFANSVGQFRVNGAGTIFAQNTTVQSISDVRLKENVKDATDGLDIVNALRPVRFDWKEGYGNNRKNQLGFIAQEVEPVFHDAVSEWSNVKADDLETYKTVGPSALIPVLVKAIQELSARLETLEKKVN